MCVVQYRFGFAYCHILSAFRKASTKTFFKRFSKYLLQQFRGPDVFSFIFKSAGYAADKLTAQPATFPFLRGPFFESSFEHVRCGAIRARRIHLMQTNERGKPVPRAKMHFKWKYSPHCFRIRAVGIFSVRDQGVPLRALLGCFPLYASGQPIEGCVSGALQRLPSREFVGTRSVHFRPILEHTAETVLRTPLAQSRVCEKGNARPGLCCSCRELPEPVIQRSSAGCMVPLPRPVRVSIASLRLSSKAAR